MMKGFSRLYECDWKVRDVGQVKDESIGISAAAV
jgi:hypothetical protein